MAGRLARIVVPRLPALDENDAFTNGGMVQTPILVRRVETTDGEVLFNAEPKPDRGVSEETAFLMSNVMADVVNAGTGQAMATATSSNS